MKRCRKCGYRWHPRTPTPKECPQCKSRSWQTAGERGAKLAAKDGG